MSSEGTNLREDSRLEQVPQRSSSIIPYSNGNTEPNTHDGTNFGLNLINPSQPVGRSSQSISEIDGGASLHALHQQQQEQGSSSQTIVQRFPPSICVSQYGPRPSQQLYQFENVERGSTIVGSGRGYNLQMPSIRQPLPHNPVGVVIGAPPNTITHQRPNYPNWRPQLNLSLGQLRNYVSIGEIRFQEVVGPEAYISSYYIGGGSSTQPRFSNTQQRGILGRYPSSYEIGESLSSRNVRMRMTIQNNIPPLTELRPLNPNGQGSGTHSPPRLIENLVYDPEYQRMGLPVDPHLRLFAMTYPNHGNNDGPGSN